jgi:hypothetical protein
LSSSLKIKDYLYVVKQSEGESGESRIEGPMPCPHLSVDAAIRYVTELRRNATSDTLRKNADKALASLKRLR